eukprot:TRINITY_DN19936_c0_g1_i4.p1 TRINITY_DN19936_c0_g1~~TRINITY_DN19936_c0_g1_i4.p1  ORF type:complete len:284 (+),score=39.56 TRINITY_DN19936_c0_g1_i4:280-1131(+)
MAADLQIRLPNGTNILLDTALGRVDLPPSFPGTPPYELTESLRKLKLLPEDIDFVVHSHLHFDHIGGNIAWDFGGDASPAGVAAFPNAIHFVHRGEWEYAEFPGCPWHASVQKHFGPIKAAGNLKFLEGTECILDEERAPGVTAILTHGHTPGHVCVRIAGGGDNCENVYYIGDSMHLVAEIEHPEWSPVFECCTWAPKTKSALFEGWTQEAWTPSLKKAYGKGWHARTSEEQRRAILQRIADEKALLVSPHFPAPGMGIVWQDIQGRFDYAPLESSQVSEPF